MKFQKTITILLILVMMASLSICALADEGDTLAGGNGGATETNVPQDPANLHGNSEATTEQAPEGESNTEGQTSQSGNEMVDPEPSTDTGDENTNTPSTEVNTPENPPTDSGSTTTDSNSSSDTPSATPSGTFKITKSPLSEPNIIEGNGTSFTAKAENATGVTWHVLNEKGVEVSADQWGSYGISVASSDPANAKISIHNASTKISGWSFYAVFTGAGTSSATDKASIKVAAKSAVAVSTTPRPVITPVPTATARPTMTPAPTATPAPTPVMTATPAPTAVPEASFAPMATQDPALSVAAATATQARSAGFTPILIVILCGVIIAAAAVTAILYANGIIGGRRR